MQRVKINDIYYDLSTEDIMPLGGLPLGSKTYWTCPAFDASYNKVLYYKHSKRTPMIFNKDIFRTLTGLMVQDLSIMWLLADFLILCFLDTMNIRKLHSKETMHQKIDSMA